MVIPSGLICLVSGVELVQDGGERAVIPLAQDFDPATDQKGSTDPLTGLVMPLRPRTVIDNLGTTGGADVHEQRQANVVLLRHPQHGLGCTKHLTGPVLPGVTEDSSCPVENIESVAAVNVWRRTRRTECEVLRTKGDDVDIGKVQQPVCVWKGGAVGGPVYPTAHARETGTHQELEGAILTEGGPLCDLWLAREMREPDHATIVPRSRTP